MKAKLGGCHGDIQAFWMNADGVTSRKWWTEDRNPDPECMFTVVRTKYILQEESSGGRKLDTNSGCSQWNVLSSPSGR